MIELFLQMCAGRELSHSRYTKPEPEWNLDERLALRRAHREAERAVRGRV